MQGCNRTTTYSHVRGTGNQGADAGSGEGSHRGALHHALGHASGDGTASGVGHPVNLVAAGLHGAGHASVHQCHTGAQGLQRGERSVGG